MGWDGDGMTEAGMMGGSESEVHDGFHIWTDMFLIEVIDLETGIPVKDADEGGLVVTPLFTDNCTPFIRWSLGDIVTYKEHGETEGPLSVFPVIQHAHRTAGFFKIRGVNINHQELEDLLFDNNELVDFKAEMITEKSLEHLVIYIEVIHSGNPISLTQKITENIKNTFEITPRVAILERGSLAKEFESSVKAPRFVNKRE